MRVEHDTDNAPFLARIVSHWYMMSARDILKGLVWFSLDERDASSELVDRPTHTPGTYYYVQRAVRYQTAVHCPPAMIQYKRYAIHIYIF